MCRISKVFRLLSIIHNGIILDLVCAVSGSVGEDIRALFSLSGRETSPFYLHGVGVRIGNSDLDSPEVCGPRGRLIRPGRV